MKQYHIMDDETLARVLSEVHEVNQTPVLPTPPTQNKYSQHSLNRMRKDLNNLDTPQERHAIATTLSKYLPIAITFNNEIDYIITSIRYAHKEIGNE
jgi:aminoglycoside phosphotransferase (APT) family kinase protein